jgi:hypothetical protein
MSSYLRFVSMVLCFVLPGSRCAPAPAAPGEGPLNLMSLFSIRGGLPSHFAPRENTLSCFADSKRAIIVVFSRTPAPATLSQLSQRAARAPFEAVTKAGRICETDLLANHFGRRARVGLLSDLLGPQPDQPGVGRERKPPVTLDFQPAARVAQFAGHNLDAIPGAPRQGRQLFAPRHWQAMWSGL